jgi:hypothetical protein
MASLNWKNEGVNRDQVANEIATLRAKSPTFRKLEQMASDKGYRTVEVTMGPRLLQSSIADSGQSSTDSSVRQIRINSDATGTFGIGGRQITVGETIAHELAHAAMPPNVARPGTLDLRPNAPEELWARGQTGAVANDLFLPGFNNAHFPITKVPVNAEQACTFANPQGNTPRDGILFLDGSRGSNGRGSTPGRSGSLDPGFNPIPNSDPTAVGFGNFAGLGSAMPLSAPHQGPLSDPLVDWLQLALAGNRAGLLAGTLPSQIPQPGQTKALGAVSLPFPQTQTTPQQAPAPPPLIESLLPEALKPLVPFFFPNGLESTNTQAWPTAATPESSAAQPNPASSAGAGLGLTPAPLTPPQFAARPPVDVPIPPALMPLVPFFFPRESDG